MLRRNRKRPRAINFERLEQRLTPATIGIIGRAGDFVGSSASMGSDGNQDIHIPLSHLAPTAISSVQVTAYYTDGTIPQNWLYGRTSTYPPVINNPTALPSAVLNRYQDGPVSSDYPKGLSDTNPTADLYINPIIPNKPISYFQVKITYADNQAETVNSSSQTALSTANLTASHSDGTTLATAAGGSATFQAQYPSDIAPGTAGWINGTPRQGDIRITLDTLPSGVTFADIVGLSLSDGVGGYFGSGGINAPNQGSAIWSSISGTGLRLSYKQAADSSGSIAEIAVPPIRNEDGATMTLRIDTSSQTYYYTQFIGKAVNLNLIDADSDKRATAPILTISPISGDLNNVYYNLSYPVQFGSAPLASLIGGSYQHLYLTSGTYEIALNTSTTALLITHPMLLDGASDAIITGKSSNPGTSVKSLFTIASSHVTLRNFQIRYSTAVNLADATIMIAGRSSTDAQNGPLVDVNLTGLNIQGPAPANVGSGLTNIGRASPDLINAIQATGTISNNTLRGGTTILNGGPWVVQGNSYVGTTPTLDTYSNDWPTVSRKGQIIPAYADAVFKTTSARDVTISGNTAVVTKLDPNDASETLGYTFRFLLSTNAPFNTVVGGSTSYNLKVDDNTIGQNMGRRVDADESTDSPAVTLPTTDSEGNPGNRPELILNETYLVLYSGITIGLQSDRQVLVIPSPSSSLQYAYPVAGDVVAIMEGELAGQYRTITQVIMPSNSTNSRAITLLLDRPMPGDASTTSFVVSVSRGVVNSSYSNNVIDLWNTTSIGIDLTGNQFNLIVRGNQITGDNTVVVDGNGAANSNIAIALTANGNQVSQLGAGYTGDHPFPTVYLTSIPIFDADVSNNVIIGARTGINVAKLEQSLGRTFITATIKDNLFKGYSASTTAGTVHPVDTTAVMLIGGAPTRYFDLNGASPPARTVPKETVGYALLNADGTQVVLNQNADLNYQPRADDTPASGVPTSYAFADPFAISVIMSENRIERNDGDTYSKYVVVSSAVVNGTATVYSQTAARQALTVVSISPLSTIENGEAGYSTTGAWTAYSSPYAYQGTLDSTGPASAGNPLAAPTATATWDFGVQTTGRYRVSVAWNQDNNAAPDAPFTVWNGTQSLGIFRMSQQQNPTSTDPDQVEAFYTATPAGMPLAWYTLGGPDYFFEVVVDGSNPHFKITLGNNASAKVTADAVRIERIGDL